MVKKAKEKSKTIKGKTEQIADNNSYTAKDIYVLEGLEPVRKRPGMYIGSTGPEGLHHLIWECVDNAIDEAMAGYAKNIQVEIVKENEVAVSDNGRGIPVDIHEKTKKSALETVLCTLHAGGKFGGKSYKVAGGLHGVGVSVVNALSEYLRAEICRDGILYSQEYSRGKPTTPLKKLEKCQQTGTKIIFKPDPEIFKEIKFDTKKILDHLRQQAYLTPGVIIQFQDNREGAKLPSYTFHFESGIIAFVKYLAKNCQSLTKNIFYISQEKDDILIEVALTYIDDTESTELSFANNIYTPEGGMHLTGFRSALTRSLNDYAKEQEIFKNGGNGFVGEDTREGLVAVVSVKLKEPQFEGQTKAKLGNPEVRTAVEQVVAESFKEFLEINKEDSKKIIEKSLLSARAREAAKKARENILRKGALEGLTLPGKLADCISKNPEESELFIVEGDSAGGSSKMGRDRNTQAILPLRGKILNIEKSRFDKMMSSEEIRSLIVALGTAVSEDFDIKKLRYHKIVIMTDADSVAYDTPIFIFDKQQQRLKLLKTGEFIENQCENTERYQLFACDLDNKTFSLRDIEKTIRHPLRGNLYEIKTRYGYKMKITSCHNVFVYRQGNFITVPTTKLKINDKIVFPVSMSRLNQKIKINISPLLKHSEEAKNIQIKILASKMKFIPNDAWVDFSHSYWQKLQLRRQREGRSREELGAAIGVYTTALEQWELKIDNVMPRYQIFKQYLSELNLEEKKVLKNASVYVPLPSFLQTDNAVEYYFKNHTRKLKIEFDINEDFAYLLGFYIGDGYSAFQKNNPNRFILCLGRDKKLYSSRLIKAISNVLGVKAFIDKRNDNNNQLVFHSYEFKLILQSFGLLGKKSYEKFVPEEIFSVDSKIQQAFLRGYLESDGSIIVKSYKEKKLSVKLTFTTTSKDLSDGLTLLFRQLGVFPENTMRFSKNHLRKDGVMIKNNYPGYLISVRGINQLEKLKDVWKNHKRSKALEDYLAKSDRRKSGYKKTHIGNSVLLPITSIKKIKAESPFVYDFAVKKDENFVAGVGGFLLHNTDGAHIRTLLLTLFFRYFRPIIDKGYLYIAQPPLYRIQKGKEVYYAYLESEKQKILDKIQGKGKEKEEKSSEPKARKLKLISESKGESILGVEEEITPGESDLETIKGISIQRYKGLGEMNPEQLWETTMDPEKRILKQVTIEDAEEADRLFDILMGKEVLPRKKFIQAYAQRVKNLDV